MTSVGVAMPFDSQRPPGPLVRPWIRAQVVPATIVGGGSDAQSSVIAPFNGESLVPGSNTSPLNTVLSAVTSDSGIGAIRQVEFTGAPSAMTASKSDSVKAS